MHYLLDPKEEEGTYRYVVVGPDEDVPLSGDGRDLMAVSRSWPTTRNEHYGDPGAMEILFVPEVPTQDELNRTWPGTADRMDRLVYGPFTHASAVRYTDPEAMVAAPQLEQLFRQRQTTTGQVTVIHRNPSATQNPLHRFDYAVKSPVFQVMGQVRFRPLDPLNLERTVDDIDEPGTGISRPDAIQKVKFAFPHDSSHKGLQDVRFTDPTTQ